ncbi:hypothetical protein B0H11DRAFT_1928598 [Mycena galericulata]|nr:hypothetical protein B0H11DRAFT_1928598 [Mycena galericulata]
MTGELNVEGVCRWSKGAQTDGDEGRSDVGSHIRRFRRVDRPGSRALAAREAFPTRREAEAEFGSSKMLRLFDGAGQSSRADAVRSSRPQSIASGRSLRRTSSSTSRGAEMNATGTSVRDKAESTQEEEYEEFPSGDSMRPSATTESQSSAGQSAESHPSRTLFFEESTDRRLSVGDAAKVDDDSSRTGSQTNSHSRHFPWE